MFFGLFRKNVKIVKVRRKVKPKRAIKPKSKGKTKKVSIKKRPAPQIVGKITHYFPHVKAGVILVTKGKIALGDTLYIKGYSTDFKQKVSSMQINNIPIKEAKPKQEIGLLVKSRVRHNDIVYKI